MEVSDRSASNTCDLKILNYGKKVVLCLKVRSTYKAATSSFSLVSSDQSIQEILKCKVGSSTQNDFIEFTIPKQRLHSTIYRD